MVIKPAAWLRSNQALQSAKNNVRRVPGSDGDSFLRLRWRPGNVSQRCSLVLLLCSGEDQRAGRRQCCRERGARPERQGLQVSAPPQTQSARGRCPPLGGRERQPSRDREFARSSSRVCALTGAARPLGLQQVAAEGDWGSGLNPGGSACWPEGLKECEGGAGWRGWLWTRVWRLRDSIRALCVSRRSVGSAPWPVTGPERTRGSGLGARQLRGAAAPLPDLGRRKVKWKTVAELSPPPFAPSAAARAEGGGSSLRRVGRKAGGLGRASPAFLSAASPGLHAAFLCFESASSAQRLFPAGPADGGWGIGQSVRPPFSPEPSPLPAPRRPTRSVLTWQTSKGGRALEG